MKKYNETIETNYFKQETRKLTSVVCDICGKEITPDRGYRNESAEYIEIHTWHNDWGNDSCESHAYRDLCKKCAARFVADYIMNAHGSEELELAVQYASPNDSLMTSFIPFDVEEEANG